MAEEGPKEEVKLFEQTTEPEEPVIELGDRIRIYGGKYDKTTGRVVYRTEDELHIIPDGLTNQVKEFKLTEEGFDAESGVESVEILQKRKKVNLVEILDLRVGQDLETFTPEGEPLSKYRVIKVDPDADVITVENDEEGEIVLPFGFKGVPKDLPFRVVRGRQPIELLIEESSEEVNEEPNVEVLEGEEEERFDFEF